MEFSKWEKLVNDTYEAAFKNVDELINQIPIPYWIDNEDEVKIAAARQSMKENLIALRTVALIPHTQKTENEY